MSTLAAKRRRAKKRDQLDAEYARIMTARGEPLKPLSPPRPRVKKRSAPNKPKASSKVVVRQSPLGAAEYDRYMNSRHWTMRKRAYFSTHPKKCVVCNGNTKIHLHHMSYERLGCELDSDLVALCELHHAGAHEHHKIHRGTLMEATLRYIERLQQIYNR